MPAVEAGADDASTLALLAPPPQPEPPPEAPPGPDVPPVIDATPEPIVEVKYVQDGDRQIRLAKAAPSFQLTPGLRLALQLAVLAEATAAAFLLSRLVRW